MAQKQLVYRSPTVTVYYKPDRRSIARCAVGRELHHAVRDLAEGIAKPYAIGIAPKRTGTYAKSFQVHLRLIALGHPELMTRVTADLVNEDPGSGPGGESGAAGIEWGSHGAPGHHVLQRTLAMLNAIRSPRDVAAEAAHVAATQTANLVAQ